MTQGEKAKDAAPSVYAEFERWLDEPANKKTAKILREARDEMHGYFEQGALAGLKGLTGGAPPKNPRQLGISLADRFREAAVDQFHGLYRAAEIVGDKTFDAWKWARRARGIPEVVHGLWSQGVPSMVRNANGDMVWKGKGLKEIFQPVRKDGLLEESLLWTLAKQLDELWTADPKTNRAGGATKEMIKAGLNLRTPERAEMFDALARDLEQFHKDVAEYMIESGTLSRAQMKLWDRGVYLYALNRMRALDERPGGMGASGLTSEQGIKKLIGKSHRQYRDPLISVVEGPSRLIQLAMENQVRQRISEIAHKKGGGMLMEKMQGQRLRDNVNIERLIKDMKAEAGKLGIEWDEQLARDVLQAEGMPDVLTMWKGEDRPHGNDVMTVLVDGKPKYYWIKDAQLLRAVEAMKPEEMHKYMKVLNAYRRFRQTAVTLDPRFIVGNFLRDPLMASVLTRTGFQHITATLGSIKSAWTKDATYWDAVLHGAIGHVSLRDDGMSAFKERLGPRIKESGFNPANVIYTSGDMARALGKALILPFQALEYAGRAVEMAPRLGEYKRSLKGKDAVSKTEAAHRAREITTDFAARGNSGGIQFVAAAMPFFNAMVQGADRLYRGVAKDEGYRARTVGKVAMTVMMSTALHAMNMQRKEFRDLPWWDKWHYWHFFLGEGEDMHFKMPKIWEVGSLASISERILEQFLNSDDPANQRLGMDLMKIALSNFSISWGPLEPFYEQISGKVAFTGAPIETRSMESREAWSRVRGGAGPTLRAFGKAQRRNEFQLSPARAEAFMRGQIGFFSVYALKLTDQLFAGAPEERLDEWFPGWGKIYEHKGKYSKWGTAWYDVFGEIDQAANTYNRMQKDNDMPGIAGMSKADWQKVNQATHARRTQDAISYLTAQIRAIPNRTDLSASGKRKLKEQLRRDRTNLMEQNTRFLRKEMSR